jgi:hypothetical protein
MLWLAWSGLEPRFLLLAVHLAFLVGLVAIVRQHPIEETNQAQVCIGITLFALFGPAGAVAAIAVDQMVKSAAIPEEALRDWYRSLRLDSERELSDAVYDDISNGRTIAVEDDIPPDFWQVMKDGPLSEQNRVLAQIASCYHSDYRGLLFGALRSPAPAIRIQAAAIVNGLRTQKRARLGEHLDILGYRPDRSLLIKQGCSILDDLGSGLLEDSDVAASVARIGNAVQYVTVVNSQPQNLSQLKNHALWAADRLPDQDQRRKLVALASTIDAAANAQTRQLDTVDG